MPPKTEKRVEIEQVNRVDEVNELVEAVRRASLATEEPDTVPEAISCNISRETIESIKHVFGIDGSIEAVPDLCSLISKCLQIDERYIISSIVGVGNYGIVLRAKERGGEKLVIKVCRLAGSQTYSYKYGDSDREWNLTLHIEFENGITRLRDLSGQDWITVPELKHTAAVKIGPSSTLGVVIMTHVDGVSMFQYLHDKDVTLESKKAIVKQAGKMFKNLHDNNYTHGDAHLSNFIVSGNKLVVIDLDRSCKVGPEYCFATQRMACILYDLAIHMFQMPTTLWRLFVNSYDDPSTIYWDRTVIIDSVVVKDALKMKSLAFDTLWPQYDDFESEQLTSLYSAK